MDIGSITIGGLASGLDTQSLINAILQAERQPAAKLENQQVTLRSKMSALDTMTSKLTAFSNALRGLSAEVSFRGRAATVSDDTYLHATAGAGAETGLFSIEVLGLAAATKVKSNALAASDQGLVSDGTLTVQARGKSAITVNVSAASGNNSLEAVRDAINDADQGVQASVIYDGSGYRLIVRSEETGLQHALTISDATNLGLADSGNLVTSAADARLKVDGVEMTSSSNEVSDVIPGTTLNLMKMTAGTPVTVEVSPDRDTVVSNVQTLVNSYNDAISFFNTQFNRDNPGALASDGTAREIQQELQSIVTGGVEGLPFGGIRSLSALGVSFDGKTGKMSLDTSQLDDLLDDRFDDVAQLFLASGSATDSRISYHSASSTTAAGDYAIQVTRAAEQASVAGSTAISPSGLGRGEVLTIGSGSSSVNVALTAGMTVTNVVDTINASLRSSGIAATALSDGGRLRITSKAFGSAASVSVTSNLADTGDGSGTGFGTAASAATGVDVEGTIAGAAATGSGQLLTASADGPSAGLTVRVTARAADIAATGGDFGALSYSRGLVRSLTATLDTMTQYGTGPISVARDVLDDDVQRMSDDISRIDARLAKRKAYLTQTFAKAEQAIAALQSQQSSLSSIIG
jgi:flagellar hook-associated protein 2